MLNTGKKWLRNFALAYPLFSKLSVFMIETSVHSPKENVWFQRMKIQIFCSLISKKGGYEDIGVS